MRRIFTALLMLLYVSHAYAQTGADLVRKYIGIEMAKKVDEHTIKQELLKISPNGTSFKEVLKKLEHKGIYYYPKDNTPTICFPADDTPLLCQFKSSKKYRGTEPDYTVNFVFNSQNEVKDIVVVRSYYGIAKRYTTNPTLPAKNLALKNKLSNGSSIKEFDSVYGEGQVEEGPDLPEDWPLSLMYFDKNTMTYFYVGVEIGKLSWNDINSLKKNRKKLGEYKAGIIYSANNNNIN